MCQRNFAEMSSQIYFKDKSSSSSASSYSEIHSIELDLETFKQTVYLNVLWGLIKKLKIAFFLTNLKPMVKQTNQSRKVPVNL